MDDLSRRSTDPFLTTKWFIMKGSQPGFGAYCLWTLNGFPENGIDPKAETRSSLRLRLQLYALSVSDYYYSSDFPWGLPFPKFHWASGVQWDPYPRKAIKDQGQKTVGWVIYLQLSNAYFHEQYNRHFINVHSFIVSFLTMGHAYPLLSPSSKVPWRMPMPFAAKEFELWRGPGGLVFFLILSLLS